MTRALTRFAAAAHWMSLVIALSTAALVVAATGATGPVRTSIVALFLALCPGLTFLRLLGLSFDPLVDVGYTVTASIAVAGIAAGVAVYANAWNPNSIVTALAALSMAITGLAAGRRASGAAALRHQKRIKAHILPGRAGIRTVGASASPELDGLRGLDDLDELYAALEASRAQILASLERSERGIGFGKLRTALQAAGGQVRRTQATVKRIFGSSG